MLAASAVGRPPVPVPARPMRAVVCGLSLAALLFAGAQMLQPGAGREPAVWACGESVKVAPDAVPAARNVVWTEEGRQVLLHGARGEYVAFQVLIRAGAGPLDRVQLQVAPLTGADGETLAAGNIDLFRQHHLKVTVPSQWDSESPVPEARVGEFPVQMVPLSKEGLSVPAGRTQPIWVDLWIPEEQSPGDYRGELQVTSGGRTLSTLNLQLKVWRFALPRQTHLKSYVPTGPEQIRWAFGLRPEQEREYDALEDRFFQMAHQHRINFQPAESEDLEAEWGGRYRKYADGTAFRERAGAGIGQNLIMLGLPEEGGEREIGAHVRKSLEWWRKQAFKADLIAYIWDEPVDEEFAAAAERARWVKSAAGEALPRYLTTPFPGKIPAGLITAWGEIPAPDIAARKAAGERVWATNHGYAGAPFVDTPGYAGRSQGWMAWKLGLDAWHFWDGCYWTDKQNITDEKGKRLPYRVVNAAPERHLTDTWTQPLTFDQKRNPRHKDWIRINGDGVLFYPGKPAGLMEPLASFTLKSIRRGFQDYEYLWLLKQAGKPADDVVDRLVPRAGEWSRDPEAWDNARLELGRRLDALEMR